MRGYRTPSNYPVLYDDRQRRVCVSVGRVFIVGGNSCSALCNHSASGFGLRILPHDVSKQTREANQTKRIAIISSSHLSSRFHTKTSGTPDAVQQLTVSR